MDHTLRFPIWQHSPLHGGGRKRSSQDRSAGVVHSMPIGSTRVRGERTFLSIRAAIWSCAVRVLSDSGSYRPS